MSTPRDGDPDGSGDRPGDGSGWQEPEHLGGRSGGTPEGQAGGASPWEPPGWQLPPPGDREAADEPNVAGAPAAERAGAPEPQAGARGWWGSGSGRRRTRDPEMERAFTYEGDPVGAQGWALQHGWTVSDGSAPQDAVLADLVASAPVRASKDHRPATVLRGRAGNLELVAFDVVYASGRYLVPEYAVTAAPLLTAVPQFRLSPARLWKHGTGGLLPIASGNDAFDSRWQLLAAEDGPQVRRLVVDPAVQGLLLGSDDGDEFWSAAGHVAAIRPDGHRPLLIEHHARLLTAVVGALAAGF